MDVFGVVVLSWGGVVGCAVGVVLTWDGCAGVFSDEVVPKPLLGGHFSQLEDKLLRAPRGEGFDELKRQLTGKEEEISRLVAASQGLKQEVLKHQAAEEQMYKANLQERATLLDQLQATRLEGDRDRKSKQELEGRIGDLTRVVQERTDEVSALTAKLTEAYEDTQRAKKSLNQLEKVMAVL